MSQENVELVRRWYGWFPGLFDVAPGDDRKLIDEAFRSFLEERFEARLDPDYPEGEQAFAGRNGAIKFLTMLRHVPLSGAFTAAHGAQGRWIRLVYALYPPVSQITLIHVPVS